MKNKYFDKPPKEQPPEELVKPDKQKTPRYNNFLVDVQELAYGYDQYLPFNNMTINKDYLLINESSSLDGRCRIQLKVEPIYPKLRVSLPGRLLKS